MIAAAVNIFLNLILIPMDLEHGYVIASYTTLIGYMILFVLHYFMVKHMKKDHVYDIKFILLVLTATLTVAAAVSFLYPLCQLRYILTVIYLAVVVLVIYKNRNTILGIIKKRK